MYGRLPAGGIGQKKEGEPACSTEELRTHCAASNERLLSGLPEHKFADQLHMLALKDAGAGRMSWPKCANELELEQYRLVPRCVVTFSNFPHSFFR